MLKFKVSGQQLMRIDGIKVVGDSRNYLKAKFDFSEDWDDFEPKLASFYREDKNLEAIQAELDSSGKCTVPWEVLTDSGVMKVSVCAGDLITANEVSVKIERAGKAGVLEPTEASPGIFKSLSEKVASLEETVSELAESGGSGSDSVEFATDEEVEEALQEAFG